MIGQTTAAVEALSDVIKFDPEIRAEIDGGVCTPTYGSVLDAMVAHAVEGIQEGSFKPETVEKALGTAASLYIYADRDYRQQADHLSGESLTNHQTNVLNGVIELIPVEAAVSIEHSTRQVKTADDFLSYKPSDVEATLAALNYGSFFRPQTMASAARTLDHREVSELLETAASTREAMPHLTVSNWVIGQIVAEVYRYAGQSDRPPRLRTIDMGSGPGATLAAITNSLANVEDIDHRPEVAITALEATPEFYKELSAFAIRDESATILELERASSTSTKSGEMLSEFGTLTTVGTDAVTFLENMRLPDTAVRDEIVVVTANYSWHRLGSAKKGEIMRRLSSLPNIIFVIGDLATNTSTVNRRYFNLAANGPLNTGNQYTRQQFGKFGYSVYDLSRYHPAGLDPRLVRRLAHDHLHEDGHLWIASWGEHATNALYNAYPKA